MTTLVVTNDFPPRIGGIESFVAQLCDLLDGDVVVLTSGPPGAEASDAARGFRVVRHGTTLLPTRGVADLASQLLRVHRARRVIFGAAAPLGLLAPAMRRAGAQRIIALTHGHEIWWATLPGTRAALRSIADNCDHLGTISAYAAERIAPALSPAARRRLIRLPPPVDLARFEPAPAPRSERSPGPSETGPTGRGRSETGPTEPEPADDPAPRAGLPQGEAPPAIRRCIAVGRLVPQKGFDTLLESWPLVLAAHHGAPVVPGLVLVGDGPQRKALERRCDQLGIRATVHFTGALAPAGVVAELQRASVFALPMRTRLAGLNPEGLGLAALEASACGLPVLVGDSGGAPETVRHGLSGYVVCPRDHRGLGRRIAALLADTDLARRMGARGRSHVAERFDASSVRRTLRRALALEA